MTNGETANDEIIRKSETQSNQLIRYSADFVSDHFRHSFIRASFVIRCLLFVIEDTDETAALAFTHPTIYSGDSFATQQETTK